ncbi:ATPase [Altererythrobacter aerius]|uniref:ATPase n=1 Tax=Tsuneonella aeria TaxID=1837929 RepID=A0A6I4TEB9_9SPHN|nr:ATPase [Tsuneonella aeria]MXO74480.1 ATPase [Tsuneonella aeria]
MGQFALPLSVRRADDPGRVVVGNANRAAVDALGEPAAWPYGTAILAGPPRSGKSLLGRWVEGQGGADVLDRADTLDETELFHRWNRTQETGRPLLLIAADPWTIRLPDLRSRLGAALHLAIGVPDDDMVAALIAAHAEARALALGDGALTYLVPRLERSFAGIEAVVATIDRLSLERKTPPTQSVWRDALDAVQGLEQPRLL